MSSVFAFRLSFSLAARSNLPFDSDRFILSSEPAMVELSSAAPTLKQARQAALMGRGYPTQPDAWSAGHEWRGHLARAFAEHGIGADLGKDAEAVKMTVPVPAALIEEQGPITWYKDVPGLTVVAQDTQLRFGALRIEGTAAPSPAALAATLQQPPVEDRGEDDRWLQAFGLWSDSVGVEDRFALMSLVRSLELLAPGGTARPDATTAYLEKLVECLPDDQRHLTSGILSLGREPTKTRVLAMIERVLESADSPEHQKVINKVYRVRNEYMHGSSKVKPAAVTEAVQLARELVRRVLMAWK